MLTNKRKGRRRGTNEGDELMFKEDGDGLEYAEVIRMLGSGRCEAMCIDGTKRMCQISVRKVLIAAEDIVLLLIGGYPDHKAEVILKYTLDGARMLKACGELPENMRLNEETSGGLDEEGEDAGEFY